MRENEEINEFLKSYFWKLILEFKSTKKGLSKGTITKTKFNKKEKSILLKY